VSLEEIVLELNNLETRIHTRISGNSNQNEFNNLCNNNPNPIQVYKSKFKFTKLVAILKISSIVIVYLIEVLPLCTILILSYFVEIHDYERIENICYWIAEFIIVNNSLMILILHRETREELFNLVTRK
jgi:hypothetical protein